MHATFPRLLAAVMAGALLLGACGDDDRPSVEDWEASWLAIEALVPDDEAIAQEGEEACTHVLGELRERREELLPAPTGALDDAVRAWVTAAEGLVLDCPADADERADELDELERLAEQVRTGIDVAR